jgi:hypothetical protein
LAARRCARALCAEGACLKLERQCKPFVYLNPAHGIGSLAAKEKPRLSAGPSFTHASPELAIGILLLLAGLLLPATLLLLTWLLPRSLVLLARILVLIAHSGSPLLNVAPDNSLTGGWLRGNTSSMTVIPCRRFVAGTADPDGAEPAAKTILYKPFG